MKDLLVFAGVIASWIVLNVWVLPLFGIRTCMSGACRVPHVKHAESSGTANNPANDSHSVREGERP
jgi:hypothetical protein